MIFVSFFMQWRKNTLSKHWRDEEFPKQGRHRKQGIRKAEPLPVGCLLTVYTSYFSFSSFRHIPVT